MSDTWTWIIGTPIVIVLALMVVKRARQVNAAVRQHFDEQSKGPIDPYAQMIAMANVQHAIDEEKRRSQEAKRLLRGAKSKDTPKR